jgi:hypothetical protein
MTKLISNNDSVETIIKKAKPEYLKNLNLYKAKLLKEDLDSLKKEKQIQKIDFAIKRIKTPLDKWKKLKYIFIPFGIITIFPKTGQLEYDQFEKYGFIQKEKEWYIFSIIGFIMYITIGIIAARLI